MAIGNIVSGLIHKKYWDDLFGNDRLQLRRFFQEAAIMQWGKCGESISENRGNYVPKTLRVPEWHKLSSSM